MTWINQYRNCVRNNLNIETNKRRNLLTVMFVNYYKLNFYIFGHTGHFPESLAMFWYPRESDHFFNPFKSRNTLGTKSLKEVSYIINNNGNFSDVLGYLMPTEH